MKANAKNAEAPPCAVDAQHLVADAQLARHHFQQRRVAAVRVHHDELAHPRPRHAVTELVPNREGRLRGEGEGAGRTQMLVRLADRLGGEHEHGEVIGNPPNIAVPTHFYKVIFAEDGKTAGNVAIGAFVMPNAQIPNDKPLKDFEVPLEAVERATGLEFATKLPAQRRRRLCQEANCSIIVKEYAERQKTFPKSRSPSP